MVSDETIDGHTGGFMGCDTLNTFPPFSNPAMFSYNLVESVIYSCHSVNSAIFLYDSIYSTIVSAQWRPGRGVGLRDYLA